MLRLAGYDIVFQEIPGEVTLALNISGCPNRCAGCHSPHLQQDIGELLDEGLLAGLLETYGGSVTCVCFMGGDSDPAEVERLSLFIRSETGNVLKTAWYSGNQDFPGRCSWKSFDFIKLGPYVQYLGGLDSPRTNQKFYRIKDGGVSDLTKSFLKNSGLRKQ